MSKLDHLKNQAKTILRWHRDGHHPVAEQIRSVLPKFANLSDREILAQPFQLSDAQELVARRNGFDNWPALKAHADVAPAESIAPQTSAALISAEPQLFVRDIAAACDFYVATLGFAVRFTYGDPPFYAQVFRDGARFNLRRVDQPLIDPALLMREDYLSATIIVDHAKALFLEFQERGAAFHQTLRTEPWGARLFIIRDPDGNLIAFASDER